MKVCDLIEFLATLDRESEIIISSDPEGNKYTKLYTCSSMYVTTTNGYEYDVFDPWWSEQDMDMTREGWDKFKSETPKAAVIWPS